MEGDLLMAPTKSSSSPAASYAGASSPVIPVNAGSIDWSGHGQGSRADSVSRIGSQPMQASLSTTAGGSAIGYSQPSCRPWERNDLLRRLSTFKPSTWSAKPKAASNLACARRGWVNGDVDKIECESCRASLNFFSAASGKSIEAESSGEEFALLLDGGHKTNCPWKGNICAESLVQFPAPSPSALIGGYKDRCDGLLQFPSLPFVATSAIEQMRVSGGLQIDHFLVHVQAFSVEESAFKDDVMPLEEKKREEFVCNYARAQKLISLCGWEPRWLPDVQDFEEHSAQSAKNGHSFGPTKDYFHLHGHKPSKTALSASSTKIGSRKHEVMGTKSTCESRSPLLDCSLCGATVRVLDFLTVARPAPIAPSSADIPETSKKMALTHGVSAASGISGWAATNGMEKEQTEDHGDAAIIDQGKLLSSAVVDLKMGDLLSSAEMQTTEISEQHHDVTLGRDLIIRQPSNSEVGDHAQSYESRGPTTHSCQKRNLEEGGSTVDKPHLMTWQADSTAGTVVDRDGDEVKVDDQFTGGPSKRARDSYAFETPRPLSKRDSSDIGPIQSVAFETSRDCSREDPSCSRNDQCVGVPSTTRASSVIAMDTHYHSADNDSMESVDNRPGDMDDVHFPSTPLFRNPEIIETSELNYSNQAQQSVSPALVRHDGEIGISSTNEGAEVLNTDAINAGARDGSGFETSGGSLGMRASVGDMEPVAVVTENQGQTGEYAMDPGLMGDFVPQEMVLEYPQGGSQDLVLKSVERADALNIIGSAKAESVESGEKTIAVYFLPNENSNHPSLSCNANIYTACEASKEEVTQVVKPSPTDECGYPRPECIAANATGPPKCESNYEEAVEFDPIKHHSYFCPWVNENVAGAGCGTRNGSSGVSAMALCGWKLTLDALKEFQSLRYVPNQIRESESAASLYKDDHLTNGPKLVAHNSFGASHERN